MAIVRVTANGDMLIDTGEAHRIFALNADDTLSGPAR